MALSELQSLERQAVMATYARNPVEFVRGEGTRLWDDEGGEYLDFLTGISVVQLGHSHPRVLEAVCDQAGRLMHVGNLYYTEPSLRLAKHLADATFGGRVFFTNSGTEAIECALKLARRRRKGGDFVVLEGAFHGRTMGSLSATPQEPKQVPFAPLVPGFKVVPRGDAKTLAAAVDENTAAVLIEPIQGESGIHPIDPAVLHAAREACDTHGALLIFDEIQCGMGRTGTLWAHEQLGVTPNVMTVAKGLGGGLPIGACIADQSCAGIFELGDHGSTFAGGPVVSAGANVVLDTIDDEQFLATVRERGERLMDGLRALRVEPRGLGLMVGMHVSRAPELARRLLLEQRLVVNATGPDTIRLLPPLTVSEAEIDEALSRIGAVLASATA